MNNQDERLSSDLTVIGLLFFLIISLGLQIKANYHIKYLDKELKSTIAVVYYVSDRLDIAYQMIDSLNAEQLLMQKQIDEMKEVKRITKELR